jgi:hypothetical protein
MRPVYGGAAVPNALSKVRTYMSICFRHQRRPSQLLTALLQAAACGVRVWLPSRSVITAGGHMYFMYSQKNSRRTVANLHHCHALVRMCTRRRAVCSNGLRVSRRSSTVHVIAAATEQLQPLISIAKHTQYGQGNNNGIVNADAASDDTDECIGGADQTTAPWSTSAGTTQISSRNRVSEILSRR